MIDIYSKADYPACELSNFAVHPFLMDGVEILSIGEKFYSYALYVKSFLIENNYVV